MDPIEQRLQTFFDPSHMAWRERVPFTLAWDNREKTKKRRVLVISTSGLTQEKKATLLARYRETFASTVSFPLKERASHLMTRIDIRVFNFGRAFVNWIPQFRRKVFSVPRSRVLETVVLLREEEASRLQTYLANVLSNRRRTIGPFRMEGHQFTEGKIDGNRTLRGGHNCSSWIATAPLGPQEEALMEILGADRSLQIGTNPGWWVSWLTSSAPKERIPVVLLWTPATLEKEMERLENFTWDFNRH